MQAQVRRTFRTGGDVRGIYPLVKEPKGRKAVAWLPIPLENIEGLVTISSSFFDSCKLLKKFHDKVVEEYPFLYPEASCLGGEVSTLKDETSKSLATVKGAHIKTRLMLLHVIDAEENEGLEEVPEEPKAEQEDFTAFAGSQAGSVGQPANASSYSAGSWEAVDPACMQYSGYGYGTYPILPGWSGVFPNYSMGFQQPGRCRCCGIKNSIFGPSKLAQGVAFVPMVAECTRASKVLKHLTHATATRSGDEPAACYQLLQELGVTIRAFRARAVRRRTELTTESQCVLHWFQGLLQSGHEHLLPLAVPAVRSCPNSRSTRCGECVTLTSAAQSARAIETMTRQLSTVE